MDLYLSYVDLLATYIEFLLLNYMDLYSNYVDLLATYIEFFVT
jgi:hypothetical protein